MLSRFCFLDQLKKRYMKILIRYGVNIQIPIIRINNSHLWHKKYSLPSTKVLDFLACMLTSKVFGIGYAERLWGDVKTIKSVNRSALGSDISEKQSIIYTYACIEEASIVTTLSHTYSKYS